jgi:hypothetical protein
MARVILGGLIYTVSEGPPLPGRARTRLEQAGKQDLTYAYILDQLLDAENGTAKQLMRNVLRLYKVLNQPSYASIGIEAVTERERKCGSGDPLPT